MVKLPEDDLNACPGCSEEVMPDLCKLVILIKVGPSTLLELERFAELLDPNVKNRQRNINNVRQNYNLEFKLRCDACGTAHEQDEITAPER